jgi:hypothetical protein
MFNELGGERRKEVARIVNSALVLIPALSMNG